MFIIKKNTKIMSNMNEESIIIIVVVIAFIHDVINIICIKSSEISVKVVQLHPMIHGIHSTMDTTNFFINPTYILMQFHDIPMKYSYIFTKGIHLPKHFTLHIINWLQGHRWNTWWTFFKSWLRLIRRHWLWRQKLLIYIQWSLSWS